MIFLNLVQHDKFKVFLIFLAYFLRDLPKNHILSPFISGLNSCDLEKKFEKFFSSELLSRTPPWGSSSSIYDSTDSKAVAFWSIFLLLFDLAVWGLMILF